MSIMLRFKDLGASVADLEQAAQISVPRKFH